MNNTLTGSLLVVLGGVLLGSFSLPMKKTGKWSWEATWLMYSIVGLLVVPWVISLVTIPTLLNVLKEASSGELMKMVLFGLLWGLGSIFFGRALYIVGISLAFALNLGVMAIVGQLLPFYGKPELISTTGGKVTLTGCAIMLVGVALCGAAGTKKERLEVTEDAAATQGGSMLLGLTLAILAGVFSSFISFALNFSTSIQDAAKAAGAGATSAMDPAWAVALIGGFITNAVYCIILFSKNKSWGDYKKPGTGSYFVLAALMGLMWMGSVAVFGRGAALMGDLGNSAGWGMWMGLTVLISNFWGFASGEWKGVKGLPRNLMIVGALVLIAAITLIGYSASLPADIVEPLYAQ